jgi:hypothetical protein
MTGDNRATVCSGCGAEVRIAGQRYGRECMNEANRKYRARLRSIIDTISAAKVQNNRSAHGTDRVKPR